jgi:hypothetical protein
VTEDFTAPEGWAVYVYGIAATVPFTSHGPESVSEFVARHQPSRVGKPQPSGYLEPIPPQTPGTEEIRWWVVSTRSTT